MYFFEQLSSMIKIKLNNITEKYKPISTQIQNKENEMNNTLQCYGCKQRLANQEAHMDYGGCLFNICASSSDI